MEKAKLRELDYTILFLLSIAEEGKLTKTELSKKIYGRRDYITLITRHIVKLESLSLVRVYPKGKGRRGSYVYITEAGFDVLLKKPGMSARSLRDFIANILNEMNIEFTGYDATLKTLIPYQHNFVVQNKIVISVRRGFEPLSEKVLNLLSSFRVEDIYGAKKPLHISTSSLMMIYQLKLFNAKRLIIETPTLLLDYKGIIIFSGNHPKKLYEQIEQMYPSREPMKNENKKKDIVKELSIGTFKNSKEESHDVFIETLKQILIEAKMAVDKLTRSSNKFRVIFAGDLSASELKHKLVQTIQDLLTNNKN